jgi:hypothetical protein
MKWYLITVLILVVIPIVSATMVIESEGKKWNLVEHTEVDLIPITFDHNKHKTTHCLYSLTARSKKDVKEKDVSIKNELTSYSSLPKLKPKRIKSRDSRLSRDYFGVCYTVKDKEREVKIGKASTVWVYQDVNKIVYDANGNNVSATLFINLTGEFDNTVNDLFILEKNKIPYYGAHYLAANGSLYHFKYVFNTTLDYVRYNRKIHIQSGNQLHRIVLKTYLK